MMTVENRQVGETVPGAGTQAQEPGPDGQHVLTMQTASGESVTVPLGWTEIPLTDDLYFPGAQVAVVTKWWGVEIHFNTAGCELFAKAAPAVTALVAEFLPLPIAIAAEATMALRADAVERMKDYGCKLVSPWPMPAMLLPISLAPREDTSLWWTVYGRDDTGRMAWNADEKFSAHHSGSNPALAEYNGKLYLVHRGFASPHDDLWWAVYDPEHGWGEDHRFPDHMTAAGPALAAFNGKLHCVHRGVGDDKRLFHTMFNGTSWSTDAPIDHMSTTGPALAVFNGRLHLVYKSGNNNQLWHATYDGAGWSKGTALPAHETSANPALTVYGGKLHLVHKSGNNTELWHAIYDGASWSKDTRLPAHESLEGPALAVLDNKLYCLHRGYGGSDDQLWFSSYNGSSWSTDQRLGDHRSGAGPAVVAYRDKNGTENQLLVVHRGYGARAAGTDTAEMEARIAQEEATPTTSA
ncbi:hypothetical protein F0344_27200 [Streptomyces finlayi]|uniref:PLL-like beta propeller domain-containing protein n=1 Tax=Streptomyces finlayi TaxID=67296 RepID=A0A7G7BR24_9ACTN|nr:hypothetical protein [Streptomyces finlayi]QNE77789.1 hypothetical protein F0344_27200 [Streptomyces finlayi]